MADTDYHLKPQRLASQAPPNHENPSKYYTNFMYKAVIVAIFLVVLPLFPSQAPEFINQTLHTGSWELVQLLFVGIAVSYGLFSRRNDETEKENNSKLDNAHSYVSRFLQVSSVFDDEADSPSGFDDSKVQTWSSQYYREEPVVVVAQENSVLEEQRGTTSQVGQKPLLLPVRSLKSRVSDSDVTETINGSIGNGGSVSRSSSSSTSKHFSNHSNKSRNGEFGGLDPLDLEEKAEEKVVLRSPIPWQSRSGRMELKEEMDGVPLYSLPPSMAEPEFNKLEPRSFRSQVSRSSRPNSTSASPNKLSPLPSLSSPKKPSPSPSFSPESQAKIVEEVARKKIYYRSSPPPAPPPPPPLFVQKPPLVKSNSSLTNAEVSSKKELKRSVMSVPKNLSGNGREELLSRESSWAESRPKVLNDGSLMGKSVRTIRSGESLAGTTRAREFGEDGKAEKRSNEVESNFIEKTGRTDEVMSKKHLMDYEEEENEELVEGVVVETDEDSESEDDDAIGRGGSGNEEGASNNSVGDGGPDVDKKAEEFIAKFREQIRLQRIASIKRSTGQR